MNNKDIQASIFAESLVSICLCTYNGAAYLTEQLTSLVNQTYKNIEIIIQDDCSTDATVQIIKEFQKVHKNILLHRNDTNLGYNKNFETILHKANGAFIALCDQDDIWDVEKIEKLINNIQGKSLIYSDSLLVDHEEKSLQTRFSQSSRKNFISTSNINNFLYYNCVSGHSMLFKKELLHSLFPFPDMIMFDQWIALNAANNQGIAYYDEALVQYRQYNTNAVSNFSCKKKASKKDRYQSTKKKIDRFLSTLTTFSHLLQEKDERQKILHKLQREYNKLLNCYFNISLFFFLYKHKDTLFALTTKNIFRKCFKEAIGLQSYKLYNSSKPSKHSIFKTLFLKKKIAESSIKKILITRYDRIGDMVLTFPLIEILKRHNPELKIDIYASNTNCVLAQNNKYINKVYVNTKHSKVNAFMTLLRLRHNNYDLAIDMYENRLSNTIIRLNIINAKQTIGLDKYRKHGFLDQDLENFYTAIYGKDKTKHIIEKNLEILDFFNIADRSYTKELFIPNKYQSFYAQYIDPSKKNILFNTEGSEKTRTLSIEQITEIIQCIDLTRTNIVLPATQKHYDSLQKHLTEQKLTIIKVSSIYQTISLLKHSDLVISPDTSIIHFASMLNKKIIGIYSADECNFMANHPFSQDYKVVRATSEGNTITKFNTKEVIAYAQEFLQ